MKITILRSLFTYICQRVPLILFVILACWFGAFLLPWISWNVIIFSVSIVLLVLFQLRLFDDLMQYHNDLNKPNRDYTIPEVRKSLWIFWFIYSAVLIFLISWLNFQIGGAYFLLLCINWIAYKMLLNKWIWKEILPLLKYPAIYLVFFENYVVRKEISDNLTLVQYRIASAILIFMGFLFMERVSNYNYLPFQKQKYLKFMGYSVLVLICIVMVIIGFQIK